MEVPPNASASLRKIWKDPDPVLPVKVKVKESLNPSSHLPSSKRSKEKTATAVPGGRA